jgi:bacillithiol system protein YtxJ
MWPFGKESKSSNNSVTNSWIAFETTDQIAEIDGLPATTTAVIFKHSTRCAISSMAKERLVSDWHFDQQTVQLYYLDLLAYRAVSNQVAEHYELQHESPQLLVINQGKLVGHTSHNGVKTSFIAGLL